MDLFALAFLLIFSLNKVVRANVMPYFVNFNPKEDITVARISEDAALTSLVYKFKGEDIDGDALVFELKEIKPKGHGAFQLEKVSNTETNLILVKELDREDVSDYWLEISMTDKRSPKRVIQTCHVLVEDVNDNSPIFKPFNANLSLPEYDTVPKLVAALIADDADEGPNGEVSYSLSTDIHDVSMFNLTQGPNGEALVYAVVPFDSEITTKHVIRVIAQDNPISGKRQSASAELTITVTDAVDDGKAKIQDFTRIREDVPVNTEVCRIKFNPIELHQIMSYDLMNENDKFTMDRVSGVLKTKIKFSLEPHTIHRNYSLRVKVTETYELKGITRKGRIRKPGKVSYVINTTVEIVNVDEAPRFKNDSFEGSIPENSPKGYPLLLKEGLMAEVYDNDLNGKDLITLKIDGEGGTFEVFPSQGYPPLMFQIVVKDPLRLDYERLREIIFHLTATDSTGRQTTLQCYAFITDMNDNTPIFSNDTRHVRIKENPPCGQPLIQLKASDADSGYYGNRGLRYSILGGYGHQELKVNEESGSISVLDSCNTSSSLTPFDREKYADLQYLVQVCDNRGKNPSNCEQGDVTIELLDENDNAPHFTEPFYRTEILEGSYDRALPLKIIAFDPDEPGTANSDVRFAVIATYTDIGESYANGITVDPVSNYLNLKDDFDFEKIFYVLPNFTTISPTGIFTIELPLTIQAYDMGVPRQTNFTNLTLSIIDKNDCAPRFSEHYYEATVPENEEEGVEILTVHATDADISSIYNRVTYAFLKEGPAKTTFELNATSGVLSTSKKIDYSIHPYYIFEIIASDAFGLRSPRPCIINITITDVNDRAPVFTTQAEDDDDDDGTYRGKVHYRVEVKENTPPDTLILQVTANDPDADAELYYSIQFNTSRAYKGGKLVKHSDTFQLSDYLRIDHGKGAIITGSLAFDYEMMDEVVSMITVEDIASATGTQRDSASLVIEIRNVNDEEPHFLRDTYELTVVENSPKGTMLEQVHAEDENGESASIRYSIIGPNLHNLPFTIDPESGIISVLHNIDRESTDWFNFTVVATDENSEFQLTSTVPVNVEVLDENDNAPVFEDNLMNISVKENSPLGTVVCKISASDSDIGSFGTIKYFIDSKFSTGEFSIDENTGVITVAGDLDRERCEELTITIDAVDNYNDPHHRASHSVSKNVTIFIEDVNDEAPRILISPVRDKLVYNPTASNAYFIPEEYNQSIITFSVHDDDQPNTNNSAVKVFLTMDDGGGTHKTPFNLIQEKKEDSPDWSWSIRPTTSLFGMEGNYSLTIHAEDMGFPQNTVSKKIFIVVQEGIPTFDASKKAKRHFTKSIFTASITPGYQIGRRLCQVQVSPSLEGSNASFYIASEIEQRQENGSIISQPQNNYTNAFEINANNGTIYLNFDVTDNDTLPGYFSFQVSVRDGTSENLMGDMLPTVKIYPLGDDQKFMLFSKLSPEEALEVMNDFRYALQDALKLVVVIDSYFDLSESGSQNVMKGKEINSFFNIGLVCPNESTILSSENISRILNTNDKVKEILANFEILFPLENHTKSRNICGSEDSFKFFVHFMIVASIIFIAVVVMTVSFFAICNHFTEKAQNIEYKEIIANTGTMGNLARGEIINLEELKPPRLQVEPTQPQLEQASAQGEPSSSAQVEPSTSTAVNNVLNIADENENGRESDC